MLLIKFTFKQSFLRAGFPLSNRVSQNRNQSLAQIEWYDLEKITRPIESKTEY